MDSFEIQYVEGFNTFWHEAGDIEVSEEAPKTRASWQDEIYALIVA